MLPSLLYRSKEKQALFSRAQDWYADLDADALALAMADGDMPLAKAIEGILRASFSCEEEDILFRQEILKDSLANEVLFAELYQTLSKGLARYEESYRASQPGYARFSSIVERIRLAAGLMEPLIRLVDAVRRHFHPGKGSFSSGGMRAYRQAYLSFFDEAFMKTLRDKRAQIAAISAGSSVTIGARLGTGLKGCDYRIRMIQPHKKLSRRGKASEHIALDSANLQMKALELRDAVLAGILYTANAVNAQTVAALRELMTAAGFYLGGARLRRRLEGLGVAICFPTPCAPGEHALSFTDLTDAGLALRVGEKPVGNTLSLDEGRLIIVTGANQGGKSTFLRSAGLAQLMMHSGLFVAARRYRSSLCPRLFTHFCRAEDGAMDSGKLDEELRRMSQIVEEIQPNSWLLMNESFASTTQREGSAIAREITRAMHGLFVRVLFVTHLYDYADAMGREQGLEGVCLLRAERNEDGSRSFHIRPGIASPTSHGLDLYGRILGRL